MGVTSVTLKVATITRVAQSSPSKALSSASQTTTYVRGGSGTSAWTLLAFTLPRDLPGTTVLSAKIRVAATTSGLSGTLTAQALGGQIKSTSTWNNKPPMASGSVVRTGAYEPGQQVWREIDVTGDLDLVAKGARYFGHALKIDSTTQRALRSKNHAAYPRLVLTYATETPAPAGVQPAGVTALAAPVFSWPAAAGVTKVQARAGAVGSVASSPSWTSAELDSTLGRVDTAAAGYPGLADNGSADFQFRQYGPLGWGAWSVPVTVTRDAYGAATIVSPAPGTVTNDYTPPTAWTFAQQSKFRLWYSYADRTLYDSGEVAGGDQEWTPTLDRVGVPDGATITSRLRLWDSAARVASPGDPGYVELVWTWTYNSSVDTPTPTQFSASASVERPVAVLRFVYASLEPDEFVVERKVGDEAEFVPVLRFDGGEHQTSSTRWSVEDPTCPPNTKVFYRVRAVTANKVSKPTSAQLVETRVAGAYLLDVDGDAWLNVAGAVTDNIGQVENTQIYKGPYAQAGIKRTLVLGGVEGSVAGFLDYFGGQWVADRPIREQLDAARFIRAHATRVYRLLYGHTNIPVTVSNLSVMLDGDAMLDDSTVGVRDRRMRHRIGFDVDQQGEFETDPDGEG